MDDQNTCPSKADPAPLSEAARLVLWGVRSTAVEHTRSHALRAAYERTFGRQGTVVLTLVVGLARLLRHHGQRVITLSPPGYPGATDDERLLVAALTAAQSQDDLQRDQRLAFLLNALPVPAISTLSTTIANQFDQQGLDLSDNVKGHRRVPPGRSYVYCAGHA